MPDAIRPAELRDSEDIARVYVDASVAAIGAGANLDAITAAASGAHAMWGPLVRPEPGQAIDVFDDGAVRGFVSVGPVHHQSGDRRAHVYALYVEPSRWGEGIGSRLLSAALGHLETSGITTAELWVQEENLRARRFYESRNWVFTGDEQANARGNFLRYTTKV